MKNYVIRAIAADKSISIFFAITTDLVEEARKKHNTTPVATAALGRTLTGAVIMGLMLKGEQNKLSVQIKGDGPLKEILAVADNLGNVKGYVANPSVDLPLRQDGKLDVSSAVGNGKMIVIKDLGLKEPYSGQSDLVSGEIAEDFTAYFAYSEQQPSAVGLGVLVDRDETVKSAGGFIIQVLPDVQEEVLTRLEERLKWMPPITQLMEITTDGEEMLRMVLDEFDVEILDKKEVNFVCDCSVRKLEKALISVGAKDLKEIIEEDGQAELTCHFCNTKYHFDKEHLERLYEEAQ
ncbi:Hsp33 family molecular chaperone HslO [Marinisporobacter balticus]|uniref:33 kDa chaperonin n=1 Tax=Marinisporobacter balticus TaxID=2018667 RepID=A0A4R2KXS3_9FIRM|nr:Hsp33 family molecular chaperone HslO [Marinisporobacter balticus]TCO71475.1 molecular chaperone Hsp33 [Marinisporobacter balticus]